MTFEITIPLFVLAYGPFVLGALLAVWASWGAVRFLQARRHQKIVQARLERIV